MFFIPTGTVEPAPRQTFPSATVGLVVANALVFALELYMLYTGGQSSLNHFLSRYAFIPSHGLVQIGLLTAMFLHGGILHIIGNMLYLLPFGDNVEDRLGHLRYVLFYVVCGIVATAFFTVFNRHTDAPLLGASGAIAGVLGGYLSLYPRGSKVRGFIWIIIIFFRIQLPAVIFIGYWFIMQLFSSLISLSPQSPAAGGGVAFMAHVGGFITGLLLAPLMAKRDGGHQPQSGAAIDS